MTKAASTKNKQADLDLPGRDEKYEQKTVDGKATLKKTTPKPIQEAADYWFAKKTERARADDNCKKAADELLKLMDQHKMAQAVVYDSDAGIKRLISVRVGEERLKIEKVLVND